MADPFALAMIQTTTGRDPVAEVANICDQVRRARDDGADFVMLPETCTMMDSDRPAARAKAHVQMEDPGLARLRTAAAETGAWLLIGSMVMWADDTRQRLANRSVLIDGAGGIVATYDKVHMFDVDLGGGEVYSESQAYQPGTRAVLADTPWGRLGMTVCYDVRFPALYRWLAQHGADFITVPSAFTRPTGEAHWHVLLRARAIETGCWVFAPAQTGEHEGGRKTYGHSLAIDPWGAVVADAGVEAGTVMADVDPALVAEARRRMPSLTHDRSFLDSAQ